MPNCRSISPETWEHARECLVFYFSRRHARSNAEDLAQETLLSIWNREDYEFENEEAFLKVCYGFARLKLKEGYRDNKHHHDETADDSLAAPKNGWGSQRATESRMLLAQVWKIGQTRLRERDWKLIQQASDSDYPKMDDGINADSAGKARVRLHRARRKLAKLVGFD